MISDMTVRPDVSAAHMNQHTRARVAIACFMLTTVVTPTLGAQTPVTIPIRELKNTVSSDSTGLMSVSSVRPLPTGGVIVNDGTKRQLVVFDSTLRRSHVIADTSTKSENSYGLRSSEGGLIKYVADSSAFVDTESGAFLIINPRGEFARVMAPVRSSDLGWMTVSRSVYGGASEFDVKGRLVYRSMRRPPPAPFVMGTPGTRTITLSPDSAPLLRMDFDKRTVDTVALIKTAVQKNVTLAVQNGMTMYGVVNPLPTSDDWTLMPDGTIAIVRVQDYHVDWLLPDGKMVSTPKMPFDWKRLTLEDKQKMVDSVKQQAAEREAKQPPPPPPPPGQMAFPRITTVVVEPTDLPDYYPPVRQGQTRADPLGNLWILPSTSAGAKKGLLYDVVNRNGEVFERVQLPEGRTLVGFGPGNTIYMNNVIGPMKAALERAEIVRAPTP